MHIIAIVLNYFQKCRTVTGRETWCVRVCARVWTTHNENNKYTLHTRYNAITTQRNNKHIPHTTTHTPNSQHTRNTTKHTNNEHYRQQNKHITNNGHNTQRSQRPHDKFTIRSMTHHSYAICGKYDSTNKQWLSCFPRLLMQTHPSSTWHVLSQTVCRTM